MTRPSTPPILSELRSASSPTSQLAALRALKNETIGHKQKKQFWVGLGVLTPIARILNTHRGNGKRKHRDIHASKPQSKQRGASGGDEEARLQAVIIVGSLAYGGPAYIPPIYAASIIPSLLSLLALGESSTQLVTASLRSLNAIADSLILLSHPNHVQNSEGLLSLLYTERHLATLVQLLFQPARSLPAQQQIALTAALISKTCQDESQRALLAHAGVLEALAFRLASFVVITGCASSSSICSDSECGPLGQTTASTSELGLPTVLQAAKAIIQNSKTRATQFLSAPAFCSVLMRSDSENTASESRNSFWGSNPNKFTSSRSSPNFMSHMLPSLPDYHIHSSPGLTSNFPPLGVFNSSGIRPHSSRSFSTAIETVQTQGLSSTEEEESPLVGWLLHLLRTENEVTGISAAWVLATLYRQGLTRRGREAAFALILIPEISRVLDKDFKYSPETSYRCDTDVMTSPEQFIKEQAPSVLALLAANNYEIQKAAADAGLIRKLSQLLKESYDELPPAALTAMWTPDVSNRPNFDSQDDASHLGADGLSPNACHVMRLRESVLEALAAIASDKDEYRKAIIENGVIPFIIKTLKPEDTYKPQTPRDPAQKSIPPSPNTKSSMGNSKDAVLAACGAARALSRSVCTLRTSLMDAGLTAPLFVLLKHPDIDFQIAATAVAIIEAGVLRILCDHAHSINTNLRLNSVWALKHLVFEASNEVKISCLGELGPGWLKQIVTTDVDNPHALANARDDRDEGSVTPIRMSTPNAAGEQVNLLNAFDHDSRAVSVDVEEDGEDDMKMADSIGALSRAAFDLKNNAVPSSPSHGRGEIPGLTRRNIDQRLSYHGMSDELAIQKEGLDLLRNLICGTGASDMIDFVFKELGQDKLFEMLAVKLRPRVFNVFNRERRSSENGVRHVQPQNEIILSICYIVVHIAAGDPRQRQLLVAQTELLKLIVPLFNHAMPEIRSCCAWICINLTWRDNASDEMNCKVRAQELARLGVYEKLEQLENDHNLDVRERSKTASHQMSSLLRS
ncbi:hypothetical protein ACLMJK_002039 [Lecanora helva]